MLLSHVWSSDIEVVLLTLSCFHCLNEELELRWLHYHYIICLRYIHSLARLSKCCPYISYQRDFDKYPVSFYFYFIYRISLISLELMKVLIPNFNIIPNDRFSLQLCTQSPGEVLVKQTLAGCKGFPAYGRWYIQAFGIKILS